MMWVLASACGLAALAMASLLLRLMPRGIQAGAAAGAPVKGPATGKESAPKPAKTAASHGAEGHGGGDPQATMVQRLTERFPAILRSTPDPALAQKARANALQGNLAQTPLHDLLQYLALGRKSGILELVCGRRTGRIVLKDGRVYKNSYRGKDGMEAMFMMMDLAEGDFEFYEQTLEDSAAFSGLEVVDIIMLWMDRKPKKKA